MMAESAARAESQGPRGFSLASILMVPGGRTLAAAWASMGSVTMRRARAAEASEDPCKNERREKRRARIGEFSWRIRFRKEQQVASRPSNRGGAGGDSGWPDYTARREMRREFQNETPDREKVWWRRGQGTSRY